MKNQLFPTVSPAALLVGAALMVAPARAQNKAESDAFPNYDSYIKITGQAAKVTGNEAAFQNRTRQPSDGGAGIEDLHFSKDLDKTTTLTVDGKALAGVEDYLARVNLTKNEVGSVDAGYKRFRTFYDGVGGFFPVGGQWMALGKEDLHIDRAKFWIEGKLTIPNTPELKINYTNELRNGRKDSTIWGSSDFTGLPFNLAPNPINPGRKFTPSYINVGERHERLELSAKQTVKQTELEFTLFADRTDNSNTRFVTNYPGEVIPWSVASLSTTVPAGQIANPQNIAKAALSAANWNNQVDIAENDAYKTQTTGGDFESITTVSDKLTVRAAASYELVHTDIGGGRPLSTFTPTSAGVVLVATDNYQGLYGGTRVKDFAGNIQVDLKPTKDWFLKFAYRGQTEYMRGFNGYNVIAASGTPATTLATTPRVGYAKIHQNVHTPVFEARYTGVKDLSIYFTGSLRKLNGVEVNTSSYNPLTAALGTPANNNVSEDHGNYTLGANWKVSPMLTLRGELFHKGHKDNTVGFGTLAAILGDYYLLDSKYSGYKLTALARLNPALGFTTRFVSQRGQMKVTGYLPTYPAYDSLDSHNYIFSETVDLNPSSMCYFQLNGTVVWNVINTVYPRAGVTSATVNAAGLVTANAFDSNKIVQNSDNNYTSGTFLSGWVVDKNTDLQVQVNYYKANNLNAGLAAYAMPYGVAIEDTSVTVGVKHKFSEKWIGNLKIGHFDSQNDTSGGKQNFHGPVGYVTLEHAL